MKPDVVLALVNADASIASSTSNPIPAANILYVSAQVVATGAPVGVLKFQASNDLSSPLGVAPTNWTDIASQTVSVGAAGTFLIPTFNACYQYLRVVYTKTSGTGSISCNVKTIGA